MKDKIKIVIGLSLLVLCTGSWVANIVKLFDADGFGEIAVRVVGVFVPPVGMVAGFF